jgi:hypothetical protein
MFVWLAAVVPYQKEINCMDSGGTRFHYPATRSGTARTRHYLKGIDHDITEGDDVIVTTDSGRLRGKRMAGITAAGKFDHLRKSAVGMETGENLKFIVNDCVVIITHLLNTDNTIIRLMSANWRQTSTREHQLTVVTAETLKL